MSPGSSSHEWKPLLGMVLEERQPVTGWSRLLGLEGDLIIPVHLCLAPEESRQCQQ